MGHEEQSRIFRTGILHLDLKKIHTRVKKKNSVSSLLPLLSNNKKRKKTRGRGEERRQRGKGKGKRKRKRNGKRTGKGKSRGEREMSSRQLTCDDEHIAIKICNLFVFHLIKDVHFGKGEAQTFFKVVVILMWVFDLEQKNISAK